MNVTHIAIGLFNATWQSAALILATALGLRACRNVGARARCTLWSSVFFLSALLPIADLAMQRTLVVAPHGPAALPARATAPYTRPASETFAARTRGADSDTARTIFVTTAKPPAAIAFASAQPRENPFLAPQRALQSIAGALLALYLLGMIAFAIRLARECLALLALKRRCTILADDPFRFGKLPRGARLATSAEIEIPCVLGFVRPLVVLPADMLEQVSPADLRRVVGHEAAHLERYDDWTNLIEQFVLAAFFYNPAMHFAVRQIATEREIACDDHVVMREGDTVTYAECLATLVHRAGCSRRLPAPGFHAGPRQIVVRIERLLDRAYSRSRRFGAGIGFTAAAVVLLAVTGVGNMVPVLADTVPPVAPVAPVPPASVAPVTAPLPASLPKLPKIATHIHLVAGPLPALAVKPPASTTRTIVRVVSVTQTREESGVVVLVQTPPGAPITPIAPLPALAAQTQQSLPAQPAPQAPQSRNLPVVVPAPPAPPDGTRGHEHAPRGSDSILDALNASGYQHLSVDELITLTDSGLSGNAIRAYAELFGHPSIDDLKMLADHGASPAFVARVKAAGLPNLSVRDAIRLIDAGVSPTEVSKYVRATKNTNVDDIIRLHVSGE